MWTKNCKILIRTTRPSPVSNPARNACLDRLTEVFDSSASIKMYPPPSATFRRHCSLPVIVLTLLNRKYYVYSPTEMQSSSGIFD